MGAGIECVSRGSYAGPPAILPVHYYDDVLRLTRNVGSSVVPMTVKTQPDEIRNPPRRL